MVDPHLRAEDEDHLVPAVTMPQGTQEYGVEFGHEERDVNFRPVIWWITGLFVTTAILCVALFGAYRVMLINTAEANRLPSPVFEEKVERAGPPLIPNPDLQAERLGDPMIGPLEYRAEEAEKERQALAGIGLWDEKTQLPRVPEQALAGIVTAQEPASATGEAELPQGLVEPMPSDSSGGVNWENRLQ